jgi:hypothetical protein
MANIVCYDLDDSPFFLELNEFAFYFSSKFYMDKFMRTYPEYLRTETLKLSVKYKMIVNADEMLLLSLYKMIEKRGFKVKYKGDVLIKDYYIECILDNNISTEAGDN